MVERQLRIASPETRAGLIGRLDDLETRARELKMSMAFSEKTFNLRRIFARYASGRCVSTPNPRNLRSHLDGEGEYGAPVDPVFSTESATMCFDDRTAYGESHAHAGGLAGDERQKNMLETLRRYAAAIVRTVHAISQTGGSK